MVCGPTQDVGCVGRAVVEDLEKEHDDENENGGRVEVGHVEERAETTHERVRRDDGGHQQSGQVDTEALNESRQCRRSTCTVHTRLR